MGGMGERDGSEWHRVKARGGRDLEEQLGKQKSDFYQTFYSTLVRSI